MKIKSSILAATASLLALAACQKEQELNTSYLSDPNAVIVNATLQQASAVGKRNTAASNTAASTAAVNAANNGIPTTRVNTESTGDAFVVGKDFFRVINTTAGADPAKNTAHYKYTADKTWTLSDANGAAATTPYLTWAEGENTFEAYMPVNSGSSYTTFTLPDNQSDVASLRNADWMTATLTKARSDADRSINLAFTHKLAKVTVKITGYRNEFGSTPPAISGVLFKLPSVDVLKGITPSTAQGINPFITSDATAAALHSYTAILAPGKYTASADFLTMSIDGKEFPVKVNSLLSSTGLQGGKSYSFDLTVGNHIATINSFTVTDWATGDDLTATTAPGLTIAADKGDNNFPIYEIYTADGLKAFADIINGTDDKKDRVFCGIHIPGESTEDARKSNARLMEDIDLSSVCSKALDKSWRPIGGNSSYSYNGVFEGNLHAVQGLYMNDKQANFDSGNPRDIFYGLFGNLSGATVKNLTVEGSINISISFTKGGGSLRLVAGGIVGFAIDCALTACHSNVNIVVDSGEASEPFFQVGGIVGIAEQGGMSDCSSTGTVTVISGNTFAGGICGISSGTTLTGCRHTIGTVSVTTSEGFARVGGIVGNIDKSGQLLGCTNTAKVEGSSDNNLNIGGVVGMNQANNTNVVACSNSGDIFYNAKSKLDAGGVVGASLPSSEDVIGSSWHTIIASFSTKIPTLSEGGSSGAQGSSNIGGVLGELGSNTIPVSTSFYIGGNDLGTNGIGLVEKNGTSNTDGGRVADLTTMSSKIGLMNADIKKFNDANPNKACPYRFVPSSDGPQARK